MRTLYKDVYLNLCSCVCQNISLLKNDDDDDNDVDNRCEPDMTPSVSKVSKVT